MQTLTILCWSQFNARHTKNPLNLNCGPGSGMLLTLKNNARRYLFWNGMYKGTISIGVM